MTKKRIISDKTECHYHVMTRTAQRAFLLEDPAFKGVADRIIKTFAEIYHVEVLTWSYMDNHIHLCINMKRPAYDEEETRCRFERLQGECQRSRKWNAKLGERYHKRFTSLSKFMWEVNRRIAVAFNKQHGTGGHFWGARYKSKILESEQDVLAVMKYIEQNAVRAGLVQRPSQWAHGTAGAIARALATKGQLRVPAIGFLEMRTNVEDRARAYIAYMDYVSDLIRDPSLQTKMRPPEIIALSIPGNLPEIIQELQEGRPSQWSKPKY